MNYLFSKLVDRYWDFKHLISFLSDTSINLTLYYTVPTLNDCEKKSFENIVGKGENAGNQHFFPFPKLFSTL